MLIIYIGKTPTKMKKNPKSDEVERTVERTPSEVRSLESEQPSLQLSFEDFLTKI